MGGSISKASSSKAFTVQATADAPRGGKPRPAKQVRFATVLQGDARERAAPVSDRKAAAVVPGAGGLLHNGHLGVPRLAANLKALVIALHEQEFAEMIDLAKEVASACKRDAVATDAQALAEALRFLLEEPLLDEMQLQSAAAGLLAAALPAGRRERPLMILIANFLAAPGRSAALAPRLEVMSQALEAHAVAQATAHHLQQVASDAQPGG